MTALVAALVLAQLPASPVPKEMKDVEFLVGSWSATTQGATVRFDVEKGPGGRSLSYSLSISSRLFRSFSDSGFLYWDPQPAAFRTIAMSSVSNEPRREIGRLADGALVMVSEPFEVDGRSERTRRTMKKAEGGIQFTLELREGEAWSKKASTLLQPRSTQ